MLLWPEKFIIIEHGFRLSETHFESNLSWYNDRVKDEFKITMEEFIDMIFEPEHILTMGERTGGHIIIPAHKLKNSRYVGSKRNDTCKIRVDLNYAFKSHADERCTREAITNITATQILELFTTGKCSIELPLEIGGGELIIDNTKIILW